MAVNSNAAYSRAYPPPKGLKGPIGANAAPARSGGAGAERRKARFPARSVLYAAAGAKKGNTPYKKNAAILNRRTLRGSA